MPKSNQYRGQEARCKLQVIDARTDNPREVRRSIFESIKLRFAPRTVFGRVKVDAYEGAKLLVEEAQVRIDEARAEGFKEGRRAAMRFTPPPGELA